jgi:ribonucleoside-diphosphate reductase alpha chain
MATSMATSSTMSPFAHSIMESKYAHETGGRKETWEEIAKRVAVNVLGAINAPASTVTDIAHLIAERKFMPGGRYLYAAGRPFHQVQNCLLMRAEDSREGWAKLLHNGAMGLMTGAGIGVNYSQIRPKGSKVMKTGGVATGPLALMQMLNEVGRGIRQGGSRRSALWAGLAWDHMDVFEFIGMKDWSEQVRATKLANFDAPATMDGTNISVALDDHFFRAYHDATHVMHSWARDVYWQVVQRMVTTAEPGFSVDCGVNAGEDLRNACTEVTSRDDSDICNLGSINMARIDSVEEMHDVTQLATLFLLAGTVYSDIPYAQVGVVRTQNRRLGLGLMGVHEWLLTRDKNYGPDRELREYLEVYQNTSHWSAEYYAARHSMSAPVKVRAIAPTGTIGIIGETSTGMEPVFCAAFKRRYKTDDTTAYQLVVDPTAKRLVDAGVDPDKIEDAYALAPNIERRVGFQAWMQQFVDHGISSTINLPAFGTAHNNEDTVKDFGNLLITHLPTLRGVTCYPDGARGGQPLTPVGYREALELEGEVFYEQLDMCDITKGGSCGA